jgi:hypothetical protein
MKSPQSVCPGTALIVFTLLGGISSAHDLRSIQDRQTMIPHETILREAFQEATLLREFEVRVRDYVAVRSWLRDSRGPEERDTAWTEFEEGTPSEFLCLPDIPPPAPVIGREKRSGSHDFFVDQGGLEDSPTTRILFTGEIEGLFRRIIAKTLPPIDQARVLRAMPSFPSGVPVRIVSHELFLALPMLPGGLEYRFRERDLVVVDVVANRAVDAIWLVIGASGT